MDWGLVLNDAECMKLPFYYDHDSGKAISSQHQQVMSFGSITLTQVLLFCILVS
jgi:hypothetical protein